MLTIVLLDAGDFCGGQTTGSNKKLRQLPNEAAAAVFPRTKMPSSVRAEMTTFRFKQFS